MKKIYYLLVFLGINFTAIAQDAYHSQLQTSFQDNFNLPTGQWVFSDNEAAILNNASGYGGSFSTITSMDTDFSRITRGVISRKGNNQWDSGWNLRNQASINRNDKVLIIFSIRSIGGKGQVNIFAEDSNTFAKEAFLTVDIQEEWTAYAIRFEASKSFNPNAITFGFHLAHQEQIIEIGGYTAINFGGNVELDDLPEAINNDQYDGFEADAPWRAVAADNIERFRKADLNIQVTTPEGEAIENAAIEVKMLRHEFAFGSAITAARIAGNNDQNTIYENKIINLDGEGHGFNWVVFENDLKWPALEQNWFVNPSELANAVQWLRRNDIEIRGHTLVWPGANNLPNDINQNRNDIPYIKNRVTEHLEDILNRPDIKGEIAEWDVLNEITTNRSLEDYFRGQEGYTTGREYLAEIFQEARAIDPSTGLWLNDFVTLSLNAKPGNANYDNLKLFTQELLDAGVDIEGIGFQGHIGGFPNGIPSVLETLDDFYNEFGLKAKITEFDLPSFVDEQTAAQYLTDFLTAIFSHESMDGFLFWSFWDGATYMNEGANLFRRDWSRTPASDAFIELLFNEWWTDETIASSADGIANIQAFKGMYEIVYESNGITIRDTINLVEDMELVITGNNMTTSIEDLIIDDKLAIVYPNPANNQLTIERNTPNLATIQLFEVTGKKVSEQQTSDLKTVLDIGHLNGIYMVKISDATRTTAKKIIIR